jgi:hypothetical protein
MEEIWFNFNYSLLDLGLSEFLVTDPEAGFDP